MQQLVVINRACGPCRGCCLPWAVPEVGKSDATWCSKSTPCNGCGIYSTRPDACRRFTCVWLNGKGGESDRPDILGVIMDAEDFQFGKREVFIFHLWEIEKGAIDKPRVQQIAKANEEAGNVVILHRIRDANSYLSSMRLSERHFSSSETALFQLTYG